MFQVQCPHCTQTIQCATEWVGRLIACPACQTQLQLPTSPVQHHQPNLTDSPPASRQTKKQVLKSQMLSAAFSDPEIYKKILQSKGFIIGAFSLLGIVIVIVIINFSLGVAQQATRALPTDIPIPDFLEPDPDPPADIIGVTLLLDENDKYAIFKFTDNQNRSVFKWFDEELAKRDWVYVKSQFDSRVWRKENRRLVVFAPGSGERQVVTIHEVPDFEWDENQFQEAVVLKPDEDKFKSWLLAVSSYHYEQKMFPFDKHVSGEDTDSGFSWAVHLLPYIGKRELYDTFDMKE